MDVQEITESFLQAVAGDIEKILIEDQANISFAYRKITDGIKLSMSINLDPSSQGIVVSYALAYDLEPKPEPPEKHKVAFKRTINEGQAALEFLASEAKAGRMSMTAGDGTKIF